MPKRYRSRAYKSCIAAYFLLMMCGCAIYNGNEDPEELYYNALIELSSHTYKFQREDYGTIINQQPLDMNWNPLISSERFYKGASSINWNEQLSDRQVRVITVLLEDQIAKDVLQEQLGHELRAIRTQLPVAHTSSEQLSKADKEKMSNEIADVVEQADRQVSEWINHSQVKSTLQLWVDRNTRKPIKVEFHTTIDYKNSGQHFNESITDSFIMNEVE